MIPKTIHYCWFGGKPIPKIVKKCIKSWKKFCPEYEIIRWDESNFDVNGHPFVQKAYQEKAWAFVSDYARLKIIYDNGGIYMDTDVEMLRNFDPLLHHKVYLAIQQVGDSINTGIGFGAVKQNEIIKDLLAEYEEIEYSDDIKQEIACPILNTKAVRKRIEYDCENLFEQDGFAIYPSKYFDPLSPGKSKNLLCKDTFSVHHYSASWLGKKVVFKRKIINLIGLSRIDKIKRLIHGNKK